MQTIIFSYWKTSKIPKVGPALQFSSRKMQAKRFCKAKSLLWPFYPGKLLTKKCEKKRRTCTHLWFEFSLPKNQKFGARARARDLWPTSPTTSTLRERWAPWSFETFPSSWPSAAPSSPSSAPPTPSGAGVNPLVPKIMMARRAREIFVVIEREWVIFYQFFSS